MKKIICFSIFWVLLQSNAIYSQNPLRHNRGLMAHKRLVETTDVPQIVKDVQQRVFPGTTVDKWFFAGEKANANERKNIEAKGIPNVYVASFKNKEGFDTHCRITENGEYKGYMTRLQGEKGLPTNIKESVNKRFSGFKIQGSQKIYQASKNKTIYRVVLIQNSTRIITIVDENGNEIKEENIEPDLKENIIEIPEKK